MANGQWHTIYNGLGVAWRMAHGSCEVRGMSYVRSEVIYFMYLVRLGWLKVLAGARCPRTATSCHRGGLRAS